MFIRGLFIRPLLKGVQCPNILDHYLHTVSQSARKIQWTLHSSCVKKSYLCLPKPLNKFWNRHSSNSEKGNDLDAALKITDTWGSVEHDADYEEFSQKIFRMKYQGQNVLVLQPYVRKEVQTKSVTNPSLKLAEAVALVQSIPHWKVLSAIALSIKSIQNTALFGSGNLDKISSILRGNPRISAVFVSVDILTVSQLIELQKCFRLPVYDRYTIVIQVFRNHATSKEAKLQVAMAEIPYLKQCLDGIPQGLEDRLGEDLASIGGAGHTSLERRREMLKRREHKIRNELEKLSNQRHALRLGRAKLNVPSVAIVGYTNAGKTSLIQVLTKEIKIQPKNRLFATLDVSSHRAKLPSGLDLVYVDTVGFMSDLPDNLIQSFKATLEDALFADLILHVWDVSHPDCLLQIQHVTKILSSLKIDKQSLEDMIIVGNKIDKLAEDKLSELTKGQPHVVHISCQSGEGIEKLEDLIEKQLIKVTGRKNIVLKVRSGSPEHLWLLENATVSKSDVDRDENYTLLEALMTEGEIGKFRRQFIAKHKKKVYFE